ncbi:MAG: Mur ligase family protein [Patescibacteria group bacterium]|nr:Mur ligase family protein [Patescibacteria group bacterium]
MIKTVGKNILCLLLEGQVKRLRAKNVFTVVAVAGSLGKTSTKLAIAKTLQSQEKVIFQDGNYNDRLTVPLVLFGHKEPAIFDVFAWAKILLANERQLSKPFSYNIAVLELGTDGPGQLEKFAYLHPELFVLTSIAIEHIEFFKTIDAIAQEELAPLAFSETALLNIDDIDPMYLPQSPYKSMSVHQHADYSVAKRNQHQLDPQQLEIKTPGGLLNAEVNLQGKQGAKSALVAAAIANELGWSSEQIAAGLAKITPVSGRMQILQGINDTTLIDDTYNASTLAVEAALDTLYGLEAPQRIAILGTMNELGEFSEEEHRIVGEHCDPNKLDVVVTIGDVAAQYLKPTAAAKGCTVQSFMSPYEAGRYVANVMKPGAVILAKGSQNGVFAEEALKLLLQYPSDANKLVRQSPYWLSVKQKQFPEQ